MQAAGRVFFEDFENGGLAKWTQDGSRSMCVLVQTGRDGTMPHGGKNMMQCNWNGTVAWNDPQAYSTVVLPQNSWEYNMEFLIRLWLKYDQDVSRSYGGKVLRLFPNDHLDDLYIIARMNVGGGPPHIAWILNGKQGPISWGKGAPLGDHRWHELEIYVRASPVPDGVIRVWIDGAIVQDAINAVTVAPNHKWGPLYLMSNWSNNPGWEHSDNNHVYWDDIEIYTDLGTGATGKMSDATVAGGLPGSTALEPPRDLVMH